MDRRTFLKQFFGGILAFFGLSGGTYYYARQIEPAMLKITHNHIYSDKISASFNDFKIVQFSDTHVGFHYSLEQLHELVQRINNEDPDIIVFTGDLIDEPQAFPYQQQLALILKKLNAKLGKYWVYGNHDHGGYGTNIILEIMNQADFTLLKNEHVLIDVEDEQIALAGLDDAILGKPDYHLALEAIQPGLFTILLVHEPDLADQTKLFQVDIQLSGHSHGGQVRFPFIGHLYTPTYAEKYVQGKYVFSDHPLKLFVSRGVGTTRLPFRFLCKPEINIYHLTNQPYTSMK